MFPPVNLCLEACLAAMDAVGIDGAVIDEFPPSGVRLDNGVLRCAYRASEEAVRRHPSRFAYVGRIDPADPDMERLIAETRSHPGRLGLRVDQPPAAIFASGGYRPFFTVAARHGVPVWTVLPGRLPELVPYLEAFPDLRVVVDHAGMLERGDNDPARPFHSLDALLALARYPNVAVKWGHVTEWSHEPFPYGDALRQLRRVLDAFGSKRVMWESDWTQCLGHQTLAEMLFSIRLADLLSPEEKADVLGRTTLAVMGWERTEDRVDTILVAPGDWDAFSARLKQAGQLLHGGVAIRRLGEDAARGARTVSTAPAGPDTRQVSVAQAAEAALYGRIAGSR